MSAAEVLGKIVPHLEQSGIPYMLVGSFASSFHGAMRSTRDVDFVIEATPHQLRGLVADLQADNYYAELDAALDALKHESLFNVSPVRSIRRSSAAAYLRSFSILSCMSPAPKTSSSPNWNAKLGGSQRQIEDVAKVLAVQWNKLDQSYLSKWIMESQLEQQWPAAKEFAEIPE